MIKGFSNALGGGEKTSFVSIKDRQTHPEHSYVDAAGE